MKKIYIKDGIRINIYDYASPDGVYSGLTLLQFPEKMSEYGIQELDEPSPPPDYSGETYRVERTDTAPYVQYIRKTQEELNAEHNGRIITQISSLERQQLLPRVVRDTLKMITLKEAASLGITEAQLLDENDPAFSPGYKRFYDFDVQIATLRSQLL